MRRRASLITTLPKILEITPNNGVNPRTGKKIGLETGNPGKFKSFEELWNAFMRQVKHFLDIKMKGNNIIEALYAKYLPVPFMSLWIEDCVKTPKTTTAAERGTTPSSSQAHRELSAFSS
ncbi:pyruvate formate lyase family protein [Thermococcus sp. 2319x1]|uniref:pyruvate formate lyase family protein n=1 Tax=Thermococcus sp. 2319x1 TaxID=1674923 RepID=UPI0031B7F1FD